MTFVAIYKANIAQLTSDLIVVNSVIFKPGVLRPAAGAWFLIITFVYKCMRECLCVYSPEAINY